MFQDVVTIYNKKDNLWFATVLDGVEAQEVVAQSTNKDGNTPKNQCNLHIPEALLKEYKKPKEWDGNGYTIQLDDFFVIGDHGKGQINDDDYDMGYQDYMKNHYDSVYQVVSASLFKTIRHIEVVGE